MEKTFWGEAVNTANFIQNRLLWKTVNKTPFEYWHGRKPIYTNLKRFGAGCYVKIPDELRRKLDTKAIKGIFLGADSSSKAYRVYVPSLKKVKVSRDVRFLDDPVSNTSSKTSGNAVHKDVCDKYVEISSSNDENEFETNDDNPDHEQLIETSENNENESTLCEDSNIGDSSVNESLVADDDDNGEAIPVRRSSRTTKGIPPSRLIEEIGIVTNGEPSSYNNAISCQQKIEWIHAMEEELSSLEANETWELVDLPPDKNLVGCKWVYKVKIDASGKIKKYKARLVAQGFSQKYGEDYDQVFAPVARQTTFRVFLMIASSRGMYVYHFDVKTRS